MSKIHTQKKEKKIKIIYFNHLKEKLSLYGQLSFQTFCTLQINSHSLLTYPKIITHGSFSFSVTMHMFADVMNIEYFPFLYAVTQ